MSPPREGKESEGRDLDREGIECDEEERDYDWQSEEDAQYDED